MNSDAPSDEASDNEPSGDSSDEKDSKKQELDSADDGKLSSLQDFDSGVVR